MPQASTASRPPSEFSKSISAAKLRAASFRTDTRFYKSETPRAPTSINFKFEQHWREHMIALDHIAIWSDNLYRTTIDLSESTGIGSTDGGYFPGLGLGQKLLSLGGSVYLEIESIVDHRMIADGAPLARELARQTAGGDCFAGFCLRSDSH